MGRFGGAELGLGSDADVMFVHEPVEGASGQEASRAAHDVIQEMRRLLALPGTDPELAVDADLRPEGRQGPLVRTLESYAGYYAKWSAVWEAQALLRADPSIGDPWSEIARADVAYRNIYLPYRFLVTNPRGDLYDYAHELVRAAEERAKPNSERLPDYTDSALPLLEKQILDPRPIYPWLEQLRLEWSLSKGREYLGADDPDTRLLLGRESPEALAARLIKGTKLADPAVRKALWNGGKAAIEASKDPLIVYARKLDARQRQLQKIFDDQYDAPVTAAQANLSQARFAAYGNSVYPDATFTLRISYGKVQGWLERGQQVPTRTVMGGAFDRATGAQPFKLADAFVANEGRIDKSTVYDFVTTNDIIGGNSGSPVLDRNGTVIGAAFDGNIHSLGGNYGFDPALNRTVVVSMAAVQEALEHIYPAPALLAELTRN